MNLATPGDTALLAALEQTAWGPELAAPASLIERRVALGHRTILARSSGRAVAAASYVPTCEDPEDAARFPRTFGAFSSLPASAPVCALYVYSLGVDPRWRGGDAVRRVIDAVLADGRRLGARWLVGDGRCPSYHGSEAHGPDKVRASAGFRAAIDDWHRTGRKPADDLLTLDPVLRFYKRVLDCRFLALAPDFLPADHASGGFRVIFATAL